MELLNIKGNPKYKKDKISGAILAVDRKEADQYLAKQKLLSKTYEQEQHINELKNEMKKLKELVRELTENR